MKLKYQMQYNPETRTGDRTEKKTTKPSLTIPDQSFSVSELMERNKRGLPLGGGRVPSFSQDPENDMVPDLARLDLAEIQELKLQIQQTINDNQGKLQQIQENRQKGEVNRLKKKLEQLQFQLNKPVDAPTDSQKPV